MQASFNVSEYTADEITVETDGLQLIVRARHEQTENDANNTLSREFTRQVRYTHVPSCYINSTSRHSTFDKQSNSNGLRIEVES